MVEIDKAAEFRKLKKQHDGEEDPVIIAQRFLNIFRQLHIFSAEKKEAFDRMLMELPPYIRGLFGSLPGGGILQEYVDDLAEKEGVEIGSHTLAEASTPTGMEFEVAKAKILATALAEAQAQTAATIAPSVVTTADGSPATVIQAAPTKIELGSNFAQELGKILSQAMKENSQAAKDEIRTMVTALGETQLEVVKVLHSDTAERRQESERLAVMLTQAQGQIAEMLAHPEEFGSGSETGKLIKMLADSQAQIAETLETIKQNGGNNSDSAKLFELSQQQFIKAVDAINENGRQNSKAIAEAIGESQQELAKLIIQQNNQRMAASAQVEGDDIKINAADYLNQLNMIADKFSSVQGNNGKNIEKTVESLVKAQLDVYREVASRQAQELSSVISAALKESQEISNKNLIKALENLPKTTIIEKTTTQPVLTTPFFAAPTANPATPPAPAAEAKSAAAPVEEKKEDNASQTETAAEALSVVLEDESINSASEPETDFETAPLPEPEPENEFEFEPLDEAESESDSEPVFETEQESEFEPILETEQESEFEPVSEEGFEPAYEDEFAPDGLSLSDAEVSDEADSFEEVNYDDFAEPAADNTELETTADFLPLADDLAETAEIAEEAPAKKSKKRGKNKASVKSQTEAEELAADVPEFNGEYTNETQAFSAPADEALLTDETDGFSAENLFDSADSAADETLDELFNIGEEPNLTSEEINKPKKKKKKKKNKNKNRDTADTEAVLGDRELAASQPSAEDFISENSSDNFEFDLPQTDGDSDIGFNLDEGAELGYGSDAAFNEGEPQDDNPESETETNFDFVPTEFDWDDDKITPQPQEDYELIDAEILGGINQSGDFELPTAENFDEQSVEPAEDDLTLPQDSGDSITNEWGESESDTVDNTAVMTDETAPDDGEWEWEYEEVPVGEAAADAVSAETQSADDQDWEWEYEELPADDQSPEDGEWEWEYEEVPEDEAAAESADWSTEEAADEQDWEWEYEEVPEDEADTAYAAMNHNDNPAADKPAGNW